MSTVLAYKTATTVYLAADTAVTGNDFGQVESDKLGKIWQTSSGLLVGFAGHTWFENAIRYGDTSDLDGIAQAIAQGYGGAGLSLLSADLGKCAPKSVKGDEFQLIVVGCGNIFALSGHSPIHAPEIAAIGSGGRVAQAALTTLIKHRAKMSPRQKVIEAVTVATELDAFSMCPVQVLTQQVDD